MRRQVCFLVLAAVAIGGAAAEGKVDLRTAPQEKPAVLASADATSADLSSAPDVNYALGIVLGEDLKELVTNYENFMEGFSAAVDGKPLKLTQEQAMEMIQTVFAELQGRRDAENLALGQAFLAENALREGVIVTESGIQYEVIEEGAGPSPAAGDIVKVHYEGSLIDGTVFDSSRFWDEPQVFALDSVIPGWTLGLQLMKVGGVYKLYVPSGLAYGAEGAGGIIPPNSTLIFDIELIEIVAPEDAIDYSDGYYDGDLDFAEDEF